VKYFLPVNLFCCGAHGILSSTYSLSAAKTVKISDNGFIKIVAAERIKAKPWSGLIS
jgi:hypothetical protein